MFVTHRRARVPHFIHSIHLATEFKMSKRIFPSCLILAILGIAVCSDHKSSNNSLAKSGNDFGSQLIKTIGGQDNLFISPASIYMALALVYLGSRGSSADQIASTFKLQDNGISKDGLKNCIRDYLDQLNSNSDGVSLLLANGLFADQSVSLEKSYIRDATEFFRAEVLNLDFQNSGQRSMDEINSWVNDKTRNNIPKFLSEPLDPSTVLAILNAIYFKGVWKLRFSSQLSSVGPFFKADKSTKNVTYMSHVRQSFPFAEVDSYKFLALPYQGENIKMLLAMPSSEDRTLDLEMSWRMWCKVNDSLKNTEFDAVRIPKFKMDFKKDLKEVLVAMGMRDIFSNRADLTGIKQDGGIKVSEVKHAATVDVNEEGTVAAAVTGVFITRLSAVWNPVFIVDRPFLFYIVDNRNGFVLFSGRVADPTSS